MASNLIINEFMTFIQNKIDCLDELSIVQICVSSFSDDEIETGNVLFENTGGITRNIQRKGEDKNKKNIKDVIKRLKETDPTLQPIFVAKDLNRLPPVTFEHVDVTRLLKDLSAMKSELQNIRSETVSKTEFTQFQTKISSDISQLLTCTKKPDQITSPKSRDPRVTPKKIISTPSDKDALSPVLVPQRNRASSIETVFTPTYRDIVQRPLRQASTNFMQARRSGHDRVASKIPLTGREANIATSSVVDDDFKLVIRKKTKLKNMRGTLQNSARILVSESKSAIYLSRAKKSTTDDDIKNHIRDMNQECYSVELLKQNHDVDFNSYKIVVPSSQLSTFLNSDFWPKGLVFRRFRDRNAQSAAATNNKING
ncbi:uncharacterized protein LOC123867718 [Maniola jurtina]|uniref:uncharacterized protein LOC123867718 n=1 Tax=Maniola jurtina TaxID=191418 RepID=UPI001E68DC3E|nr:uncharacterized protein LOC123867718 [Maniola jurtina]